MMIEIDDKIVSLEILSESFACDIAKCKGECCVDGNSGAPLEVEEIEFLKRDWEAYKKYMPKDGVDAVEAQGFVVLDEDGDLTTPLVDEAECAYAYRDGDLTLCAIEKAWLNGECEFRKPISCHLYPIRLVKFRSGGVGLNYHRWSICRSACENGKAKGIPIYKSLREAIVRRFGEDFYEALDAAAKMLEQGER